jgi:hypothetical protein
MEQSPWRSLVSLWGLWDRDPQVGNSSFKPLIQLRGFSYGSNRKEFAEGTFTSLLSERSSKLKQGSGIAQWYSAGLRAGWSRVRVRAGTWNFLFTTASSPTLGPTQPPVRGVSGVLSLGVKRSQREANHSPSSSTEVNECVKLYLHSSNTPSWRGAQLKKKDRYNFNLLYFTLLYIYPVSFIYEDIKFILPLHGLVWNIKVKVVVPVLN